MQALNKLREFCERAGQKVIDELNTLIDNTELNEYIRMAFNDENPTLDNRNQIRPSDFLIKKDELTGEKIIRATTERGLSFCSTLEQFVKVAQLKARRYKNTATIHIYKINEAVQLPIGLAFHKDSPGHISLIVTKDMSWNELVYKLSQVGDLLEYIKTMEMIL